MNTYSHIGGMHLPMSHSCQSCMQAVVVGTTNPVVVPGTGPGTINKKSYFYEYICHRLISTKLEQVCAELTSLTCGSCCECCCWWYWNRQAVWTALVFSNYTDCAFWTLGALNFNADDVVGVVAHAMSAKTFFPGSVHLR